MEKALEILSLSFYGNSLSAWSVAVGSALLTVAALWIIQAIGVRQIRHLAHNSKVGWAATICDSLLKTRLIVLILIALYAGTIGLDLPEKTEGVLKNIALSAFLIQAGLWATGISECWLSSYRQRKMATNAASVSSIAILGFTIKVGIWIVILLMVLDNAGVNITTLVAGLGIGGVAIALAVQNILGDLFASLTIVMDKPFVVGDFLSLGPEHMGTVEYIGLKTTRLRSLSGEQIILSNSDLLQSRIRNFGRMYERRLEVRFGVAYHTPREKLRLIPHIVREAVQSQQKTRFDRAHFKSYGDYSLNFEYVYFVTASEYNLYMDINQAINLFIHERFEQKGIEFAFPTQTVYYEGPKPERNGK